MSSSTLTVTGIELCVDFLGLHSSRPAMKMSCKYRSETSSFMKLNVQNKDIRCGGDFGWRAHYRQSLVTLKTVIWHWCVLCTFFGEQVVASCYECIYFSFEIWHHSAKEIRARWEMMPVSRAAVRCAWFRNRLNLFYRSTSQIPTTPFTDSPVSSSTQQASSV